LSNGAIVIHLQFTKLINFRILDEYRRNWLLHLQRKPQNRINLKSYLYSPQGKKQLGDQRNDGESNCNSGDGKGPSGPNLDVYDDDFKNQDSVCVND
jgi:hypothetical protein